MTAGVKMYFRVLGVLSIFAIVALESAAAAFSYCSNDSVSCMTQLLHLNASNSACMVVSYLQSDCAKWSFNVGGLSHNLGAVVLKAYPYEESGYRLSVFNVSLTDIRWTSLRFRFKQNGYDNKHFCREFNVSSEYSIPELFYDCLWTKSNYEETYFTFEYEAQTLQHTEVRKYVTELPSYKHIAPRTELKNWSPFLYVDVSESPVFIAKWQQAPSHFGVQNYRVQVFSKVESSEMNLQASEVIPGANENHELSYKFDAFHSGDYHFEVCILSNNCTDGLCKIAKSPYITVRTFIPKTLIFCCLILLSLFLFILCVWRRQHHPVVDAKLPVVLIIYTPSHAAHVKCMVTLTEYLRNVCFVEALLDQLDIQVSETKDPFMWCNEAFSRADFVMVVSSPPKCCNQEGIFRNVDVIALHFLKEKFSERNSRPDFFSVLMPYCTERDIPDEAKNLRMFKLTKDFDKMLRYIHNGGRFPTVMDYARTLLGPKLRGGKSDLNSRGCVLLAAMKEAEYDCVRVCNCKKLEVKENDVNGIQNTRYLPKLLTSSEEGNELGRNMCGSDSTDYLCESSEPLDVELPFLLDDLDLTGTAQMKVEPVKNSEALLSGVDLNSMKL
ncbi:uncharacterized protein LOC110831033 isoform X2 [Zootermopsis nevadensis]|uniref:uncharacterized protein LOC110831033 isoform X2 n=1 Tax=Zootermopsis nevadensis TaxID=136037 RepID=UPI000B8E71D4|nr:uncharacterized protein LOC110831033 isoform X2 [Zootermopsis nevadensis]